MGLLVSCMGGHVGRARARARARARRHMGEGSGVVGPCMGGDVCDGGYSQFQGEWITWQLDIFPPLHYKLGIFLVALI